MDLLKKKSLPRSTLHSALPRLNGYPAGLGKGHDAAVVSAWLEEDLEHELHWPSVVLCLQMEGGVFIYFPPTSIKRFQTNLR